MDTSNVHLLDVLPLFSGTHLGLQGLACLSACSKQLQSMCFGPALRDADRLLTDALEEAAALADQGDILLSLERTSDDPDMQQQT
jgi:hypothetical protein